MLDGKGSPKDEVTYIFLIEDTDKGAMLSDAQRKKELDAVNNFVKKAGGKCRLFSTSGAPCDFVSIISGVSPAAAIKIAAEIGRRGTVKATLITGLEIFNTP